MIDDNQCDLQIIITAHNVEQYLKDCLNSAVLQENSHYKIHTVITDDGSPDISAQILEEYSDRDNFIIIHQNNQGCQKQEIVA